MSNSFAGKSYITVGQLRYSGNVIDTIYVFRYLQMDHEYGRVTSRATQDSL